MRPTIAPQVSEEDKRNLQQFNTPQPVYNENYLQSQQPRMILEPVPLNITPQQGVVQNQQSQSQVNPVPQIINQQSVPVPQQVNIVRRSNVVFGNQVIPQQQIIPPQQIQQIIPPQQIQQQVIPPPQIQQQQVIPQQVTPAPYQVAKTTSVYATPQGVTKV